MEFTPEGRLLDTAENLAWTHSPDTLEEAARQALILEGRALLCSAQHDLLVDLNGVRGVIPREEVAVGIREGLVRDIAILSRVNRPVCFVVKELYRDKDGALCARLSRREAQERCQREYLSSLRPGDVIDATITHLEPFGAFADIGCGIASLLPIDAISVSRIGHPRERFTVGMEIRAVIRSIENGRVTLSQKELLGTWEENAAQFAPGETVAGIVRGLESYGAFVELTPNLAGLAEPKEGIAPGQQASVFIKSILPQRMKVKLILIETFDIPSKKPGPPHYYFTGDHMDRFVYSPPDCEKRIASDFTA